MLTMQIPRKTPIDKLFIKAKVLSESGLKMFISSVNATFLLPKSLMVSVDKRRKRGAVYAYTCLEGRVYQIYVNTENWAELMGA